MSSRFQPESRYQLPLPSPQTICTAFFTLHDRLQLDLPWSRPSPYISKVPTTPILIWGAASSVGQYAMQILKHWGYPNVIAIASLKHPPEIKSYGAARFLHNDMLINDYF